MDRVSVRARSTDPETSHQAALQFEDDQPKAQRSVRTVVQILTENGPLSDFRIRELWTKYWGDDKWSFTLPSKARHWARQQGLIRHAYYGEHQGRRVRTWCIGYDTEFLTPKHCCPTCGHAIKRAA